MAKTIAEKLERQRVNQIAAQKRARARAIAKMNDPEEREKRIAKAQEQRDRQIKKLRDPEHQRKLKEKALQRQERARNKPAPKAKPKTTRGLKGRPPTAEEKRIMDAIGKLPCIACWLHGRESPLISLHHTKGRTIANAHRFILPLCCFHHDTLLNKEQRELYPDMVPIHAKGKYGGKGQWYALNGTEDKLLEKVYQLAGIPFDFATSI